MARPLGHPALADTEQEFLTENHSREADRERLARIASEFERGFDQMHDLGPAVPSSDGPIGGATPEYELGVHLGRELAEAGFTVITGGGPGLMEAANRGAFEAGGRSIGCNIVLPHEQSANPYLERFIDFDYFFVRKVMLVKYSSAFVSLPGGSRDPRRDVRGGDAHSVPLNRAVSVDPARRELLGWSAASSSGTCVTAGRSHVRM